MPRGELYSLEKCLYALDDAYHNYGRRFSRREYMAWREERFGRSRSRVDGDRRIFGHEIPDQRTVRRRFGSWAKALDAIETVEWQRAEDEPYRRDRRCEFALEAAYAYYGRAFSVREYERYRVGRDLPSSRTIARHFEGFKRGVDLIDGFARGVDIGKLDPRLETALPSGNRGKVGSSSV
jgi:hypothetical protein